MTTRQITLYIDPDTSRIGEDATPSDLDRYHGNLSALIAEEFNATVTTLWGSLGRGDQSPDADVQKRLNDIAQTDEWITLL